MFKDKVTIREIQLEDNIAIEKIIKDVFVEYDLPLEGTAYQDIETTKMYQTYQKKRAKYFVIESNGEVFGGAGFQELIPNSNVCEVQKMYFSPKFRGLGYGKYLFNKCLREAKKLGFSQCYLETISSLKSAMHIYEKNGFKKLDSPMGNTGHGSCGVWMLKDL